MREKKLPLAGLTVGAMVLVPALYLLGWSNTASQHALGLKQRAEPALYITRQEPLDSLAQLGIPCSEWLVNGTVFDASELLPPTSLPKYSRGQEPSRCDWPDSQPFNKSAWSSIQYRKGSTSVRYKLYKGALYRDR